MLCGLCARVRTIDSVSAKCMVASLGFVCDLRQTPIDPGSTFVGRGGHVDFEHSERPLWKYFAHERHRDVEHRHAFDGATLRPAVMRVTVEDGGDRIAAQ